MEVDLDHLVGNRFTMHIQNIYNNSVTVFFEIFELNLCKYFSSPCGDREIRIVPP
jgi:hypothetical protein